MLLKALVLLASSPHLRGDVKVPVKTYKEHGQLFKATAFGSRAVKLPRSIAPFPCCYKVAICFVKRLPRIFRLFETSVVKAPHECVSKVVSTKLLSQGCVMPSNEPRTSLFVGLASTMMASTGA